MARVFAWDAEHAGARHFLLMFTALALGISVISLLVAIVKVPGTNSRPVITASISGTGPYVVTGSVTTGGLASSEQLDVDLTLDADTVSTFHARVGADDQGVATVPLSMDIGNEAATSITIIAWLPVNGATKPTCDPGVPAVRPAYDNVPILGFIAKAMQDRPALVSCITLALPPSDATGPVVVIAVTGTGEDRAATVSLRADVRTGMATMLQVWGDGKLLHSSLAYPAVSGITSYDATIQIGAQAEMLCALATVRDAAAAQSAGDAFPGGCRGPAADTFGWAEREIPAAASPSPTPSASPKASTAP